MSISDLSGEWAEQRAAFEDRMVNELLDKHGLKGKTKRELELLGYVLDKRQDIDNMTNKQTYILYKYVDSTSFKVVANFTPEYQVQVTDLAERGLEPKQGVANPPITGEANT